MFRALLRSVFARDWVVYAKKPFGGPEHVLHYLARYTHRVATPIACRVRRKRQWLPANDRIETALASGFV